MNLARYGPSPRSDPPTSLTRHQAMDLTVKLQELRALRRRREQQIALLQTESYRMMVRGGAFTRVGMHAASWQTSI